MLFSFSSRPTNLLIRKIGQYQEPLIENQRVCPVWRERCVNPNDLLSFQSEVSCTEAQTFSFPFLVK